MLGGKEGKRWVGWLHKLSRATVAYMSAATHADLLPACPERLIPSLTHPPAPCHTQFRQAMFKLEFKARQQLEVSRGNGGGRKRPAASAASACAEGEGELSSIIQFDETIRQQAMLHLRRLLNNCGDEL